MLNANTIKFEIEKEEGKEEYVSVTNLNFTSFKYIWDNDSNGLIATVFYCHGAYWKEKADALADFSKMNTELKGKLNTQGKIQLYLGYNGRRRIYFYTPVKISD